MRIRIGTRKSRLAVRQTEIVRDIILASFPEAEIEMVPIATQGDKQLDVPLASFGGKGVFTRELEDALAEGHIDMAVHSAKDMPMEFREGLCLGAVLEQEDIRDVLVTRSGIPARSLPPGSVIGTSSLRREIQIRHINDKVEIKLLRGNVQTRLEKLRQGEYDGILLAAAGIRRLGLEPEGLSYEYLDPERFVPAAGQGIMAVEVRCGDLGPVMEAIHSPGTAAILHGERALLASMGGGCNAPCGVFCREEGNLLTMTAMYAHDGRTPVYRTLSLPSGPDGDLYEAADRLAREMTGKLKYQTVSLVGAGPGSMDLVSQKALDCVARADVIYYDHLIPGSLLNCARLDARLVCVGKRAGRHAMAQEEISRRLAESAMEGQYVVRLKGGDPFVFGRGAEEALELKRQGIPFEVVPGVSSAYSVPAYAGIPVTCRKIASSFHVVTGHECLDKDSGVDYQALARQEGTLVFLMGLGHLEAIAAALVEGGKSPDTPAAVIQQGATARQRQAVATLAGIAEAANREGIRPPAVVVVGEVAALAGQLCWRRPGSLSGCRILLTGTRAVAEQQRRVFEALGAETLAVSLIESRPIWGREVEEAFQDMSRYQWLVLTSRNGVELFFKGLKRTGRDVRSLAGIRFSAIGRETADALRQRGVLCDFVPTAYSSEVLAREWIPHLKAGDRVLLLRARGGSPTLSNALEAAGICFREVSLYENWVDERRGEELNRLAGEVDYITIASSSAARALKGMAEDPSGWNARFIAIGPVTAEASARAGVQVYASATDYTASGMADVIQADWGRRQWEKSVRR